jgi:hypothetical protein
VDKGTIDLERIVYDPTYRREVIKYLNGFASQASAACAPERPSRALSNRGKPEE